MNYSSLGRGVAGQLGSQQSWVPVPVRLNKVKNYYLKRVNFNFEPKFENKNIFSKENSCGVGLIKNVFQFYAALFFMLFHWKIYYNHALIQSVILIRKLFIIYAAVLFSSLSWKFSHNRCVIAVSVYSHLVKKSFCDVKIVIFKSSFDILCRNYCFTTINFTHGFMI